MPVKSNTHHYRVYHGPFDVGGNAYYLSRGERSHGLKSNTIVYSPQWFGFPTDIDLKLKPGSDPLKSFRWWTTMFKVALTADILHFNFGGSFLNDFARKRVLSDLPFWKELGIFTFVTFQGCDSRISTFALSNFKINACANCPSQNYCGAEGYNFFKEEVIAQIGRYFNGIFALNPDLMHNIEEARFLPYSNCDIKSWTPPNHDRNHPGPVRVIHAPTWREIKGTAQIITAIEDLKKEGEPVELVLIENIPHDQVRQLYENCDILVDQLFAGWYGGLAVELMSLGKPVMAYIRQDDLKFIPDDMRQDLPIISVDENSLKSELRKLIRNRDQMRKIGNASRLFIERWHNPDFVAKITMAAYQEAVASRSTMTPSKLKRVIIISRKIRKIVSRIIKAWLKSIKHQLRIYFLRLLDKFGKIFLGLNLPIIYAVSFIRLHIFAKPASVWGSTPILTIPLLSTADKLLGFSSMTIVLTTYHITKNFDISLKQLIERTARKAPYLLPYLYKVVFMYCLFRFDVFHYFYDQGFLPREGRFGINKKELIFLRKAGKKVYLYAYGADVRTRSETIALGKYNCCLKCDRVMGNCICDSEENQQKQELYRNYVTARIAMGDMINYVPDATKMHYWPIDTTKIAYCGVKWNGNRPLKILHAPNHPWAKGSWLIEKAVQELENEGVHFELIEVTKMPNQELMELMDEIDIVADQFIIGFYGYTALEALLRGKIVLCFIRNTDDLIDGKNCPIVQTHPEKIKQVLRRLALSSPSELKKIGLRGRQYVEKYHSVSAVANRLGVLYLETASFPARVENRIRRRIERIQ